MNYHFNFKRHSRTIFSRWILAGLALNISLFSALAVDLKLSWDPSDSPDVAGYTVYYGNASGVYTSSVPVGNVTNTTLSGFSEGATAFFAVTASDSSGLESDYSGEVQYTVLPAVVPPPPPPPPPPPSITLSAPANNASFVAPATINLAATVVDNGHTLNKVQFFNGTSLLAESTAAPYNWTWTNVDVGTYSLSAVLVYDTSSQMSSSTATVQVTGLPAPWKTMDVGTVVAGSGTASSGVFALKGAGIITGRSDSFRFVYQTLSGDGEIRAQVQSFQGGTVNGNAGVMIRESLTPGSRYVLSDISTNGTCQFKYRKGTGSSTTSANSGSGVVPNTWLRLVRSGGTITSYRSADGTNWTKMGSVNLSMASNIYLGLVVASGQANILSTSSFGNVVAVP